MKKDEEKFIKDIPVADGSINMITRLLVKADVQIPCVISCLIKGAVELAAFHYDGDWKKYISECRHAHIERVEGK